MSEFAEPRGRRANKAMIPCPRCAGRTFIHQTKALHREGARQVMRRRRCVVCAVTFTTYEVISPLADLPRTARIIEAAKNLTKRADDLARELTKLVAEWEIRTTGDTSELQDDIQGPRVQRAPASDESLEGRKGRGANNE